MAISAEKSEAIAGERKKQILDAAIILFDEIGFTNTKISDISEKAGISKGLIYRYFNSKEEILLGISSNVETCIAECASLESAEEGIKMFILRLLSYPYYEGYIPPMRVLFAAIMKNEISLEGHFNPFVAEWGKNYFGALFKKGQTQGTFRKGDPEQFGDFLWRYLLGALTELCQKDAKTENRPNTDEILSFFK